MISWEEKSYDNEILSIDGVSDKEHFYRNIEKSCRKCAVKASPSPFNNFGK